jgi:hypothetical protein
LVPPSFGWGYRAFFFQAWTVLDITLKSGKLYGDQNELL